MLFRGKYWFLSNMYPCNVTVGFETGVYTFSCAEAAFQACKNPNEVEQFLNVDGFEAKRRGRKVSLAGTKEEWDKRKDECMELVVKAKFDQNPQLVNNLLSINGDIIEENTWNDKYWGMCRKFDHTEDQTLKPVFVLEGENKLGKILMKIRSEYEKK